MSIMNWLAVDVQLADQLHYICSKFFFKEIRLYCISQNETIFVDHGHLTNITVMSI